MPTDTKDRFTPTKRTRLKRLPKRASYKRGIIYQILDEAFVCHVGFIDSDQPVVIPNRSVVIFGAASVVKSLRQKLSALRAISEHILRGRWADVRRPSKIELQQTLVLRLPLAEASAKVRNGPPIDEETDYSLPVWAGEVPLSLVARQPIADSRLRPGMQTPAYIQSARVRSLA